MYASRITDACKHCGTPAAECAARDVLPGAGACCRRCRLWSRSHRERTVRVELPEPAPPRPVTSVTPTEVLDRGDGPSRGKTGRSHSGEGCSMDHDPSNSDRGIRQF